MLATDTVPVIVVLRIGLRSTGRRFRTSPDRHVEDGP
jgi:hypothetical protein